MHIAEGINHRHALLRPIGGGHDHLTAWRIHFVKVDPDHRNPSLALIQCSLDQLPHIRLNRSTIPVQDRRQFRLRNHLAHRRFRNRPDRLLRFLQTKQKIRRILDVPNHLKVDIHDVFIRGQHQAQPAVTAVIEPERFGAVGGDVELLIGHKRPRRKIETIGPNFIEFSKEELNGLFLRLDRIKGREQPHANRRKPSQDESAARDARI